MTYLLLLITYVLLSFLIICSIRIQRFRYSYSTVGIVFLLLFSGLFFSQMIMYKAGSNISPYAYTRGLLKPILLFGRTYSSWLSITITAYSLYKMLLSSRNRRLSKQDVIMYTAIFLVFLIGIFSYSSFSSALSEGTKYVLPFLTYGAVKVIDSERFKESTKKLLTFSNIILILQVALSKIITGKFAASTYYLEMQEEYFGFYNHPHGFTGLLGMLTIWCVFNINRRNKVCLYSVLAIINMILMYISGSRSYVYSLLIAVVYILMTSMVDQKLKRMRKYAFAGLIAALFFGKSFITNLGAHRVTNAVLSGRGLRWVNDLNYFFSEMSWREKLTGGGFGYISDVNQKLSGVYVNSLNIFIDILIDNGIVGVILTMVAYAMLFSFYTKRGNKSFSIMVLFFFVVSSFVTNFITYQVIPITMVLILYVMAAESKGTAFISNNGGKILKDGSN